MKQKQNNTMQKLQKPFAIALMVLALYCLIPAGITYAQNRARDVIKLLQERFESLNDFTADLVQVRKFEFSGVTDSSSMKISLLKEDFFKIESSNVVIVTDGKIISDYDIFEKRLTIDDVDESSTDSFLPRDFLFKFPDRYDPVDFRLEDRDGSKGYLIAMEPKKPDEEIMQSLEIWIDSADSLIKYVRYTDIDDNDNVYFLSNYKIDIGLTPEHFELIPAEGVKVVDLRRKKGLIPRD